MASRNRTRTAPAVEAVVEAPTYGPSDGGNIIAAAWPGLFNLFGARVQRFDVGPDGITAIGVTVNELYDLNTIVNDIYHRGDKTVNPKLDFLALYPIVRGIDPAPFTTANQLTSWMVKYIKGGSRSPKYAKEAIQRYKEANGMAVHRGRPKKTFNIKEIGSLDAAALEGLDPEVVEKFRATLDTLFPTEAEVTAE